MTRNQQHQLQRQNTPEIHLSSEQSQLVLQKLQAISVASPSEGSNAGATRGMASSTSRTNGSDLARPGTASASHRAGASSARRPTFSEVTPRQGGYKPFGASQSARARTLLNQGEDSRRRPESAPSKGEEGKESRTADVRRPSKIAFVDPPKKSREDVSTEGVSLSRPTSAVRGKVSGSISLSRPLSSSVYKSKAHRADG
jgi:hypothetical protein